MTWTAPRTWVTGETVTAANMNTHVRDNLKAIGDAWTSYTPTLAQGVSTNIAKTVTYAKYVAAGKLIICQVRLDPTAAGTAGSPITITLPVTAASSVYVVGSGSYSDTGTALYPAIAWLTSTTTLELRRTDQAYTAGIGADPNFAVANTDVFRASFMYEAA